MQAHKNGMCITLKTADSNVVVLTLIANLVSLCENSIAPVDPF